MAKVIIQVFRLDPPFPDVSSPNSTLYIDATAADNLGISGLVYTGEIKNINFVVGAKSSKMTGVLHSLEFPFGNIIRLTNQALVYFNLINGRKYWMEWTEATKTLKVLRQVNGK